MAEKGLAKKMIVSEELYEITGKKKVSRGEAVKAIWAYATENDLKEVRAVKSKTTGKLKNTAGITPDAELAAVFGSKKWHSMGEIGSAVSKNLSDD
jgi:chromatin remodeling complex protein RSC6